MPNQNTSGLLTKRDIDKVLFLRVYGSRRIEVHKHAKKERGQYPAILTEQAWSIKDLLYGIRHQIILAGQSTYPERAR